MALHLATAETPRQISQFVQLAQDLNAGHALWVPPLHSQDLALLTPGKHPFWETARRQLLIAHKDGKAVGRIAAIIDDKYNEYAGERCGAFGFFESINDPEVAHALLERSREWLKSEGMDFMRGPLNPSTNYTCGMLVQGFDAPPGFMMPWNPPWYPALLESWRLAKEQDLFAYVIDKTRLATPEKLRAEARRLMKTGQFTCRPSSKKTMARDVRAMLDIYRESWAQNWGFSPLSAAEAEKHVEELQTILDPDFFVLFFHQDRPVAGMVALPDLTPLLKRLKGRMGILAPWHFLRTRKLLRRGCRIMLFGILPQFRLYGLPLLLFDYMLGQARRHPYLEWVEGSWVLEDNVAINDLIEDFSGVLTKRYRIYRREIGPCPGE